MLYDRLVEKQAGDGVGDGTVLDDRDGETDGVGDAVGSDVSAALGDGDDVAEPLGVGQTRATARMRLLMQSATTSVLLAGLNTMSVGMLKPG